MKARTATKAKAAVKAKVNPIEELKAAAEQAAAEQPKEEQPQAAEQPTKKQPTQRTVRRRKINADGKIRLLNFTDVFKDVRSHDLGLPNRVNMNHVEGKQKQLKVLLLADCSEGLKAKSDNHWYFNRLPKLVTEINYLKQFMTESEVKNFSLKAWSNTKVIDLIVKGLTSPEKLVKK